MPSAGWERSVDRAMQTAHRVRLWRGGVRKEDKQEKLAAVELLKQVLFTHISSLYNNFGWSSGSRGGSGGTFRVLHLGPCTSRDARRS